MSEEILAKTMHKAAVMTAEDAQCPRSYCVHEYRDANRKEQG
jgi:hypothetical protein